MKHLTLILLLASCTHRSSTIEERKCDATTGKPDSKVISYYASQGIVIEAIEQGEIDDCKACDCRTGRVFVYSE